MRLRWPGMLRPRRELITRFAARNFFWLEDASAPPHVRAVGSLNWKRPMRSYIQALGLTLPHLYFDVSSFEEIDFESLPESIVIKPANSYDSRGVMLIRGDKELLTGAFVSRSRLLHFCRERFDSTYFETEPGIFVEEFLTDYDSRFPIPRDFKIYVAGGRSWIIEVIDRNGRKEERNHSFYTRDLVKIGDRFQTSYKPGHKIVRPSFLSDLINAAEQVARDTMVFCRLDFYITPRGPVFGEFTCSPFDGYNYTTYGARYLLSLMDSFPDLIPQHWSQAPLRTLPELGPRILRPWR